MWCIVSGGLWIVCNQCCGKSQLPLILFLYHTSVFPRASSVIGRLFLKLLPIGTYCTGHCPPLVVHPFPSSTPLCLCCVKYLPSTPTLILMMYWWTFVVSSLRMVVKLFSFMQLFLGLEYSRSVSELEGKQSRIVIIFPGFPLIFSFP